jgi:tetratricopeptide (TPR) repeat protein
MSSQTKPKKTRAQLRAEKDELFQGALLIKHMGEAYYKLEELGCPRAFRDDRLNALLVDAIRACRIFRASADTTMAASGLGHILPIQGKMHQMLGQHALALVAFQEADEILISEEQKGNETNNLEVLAEMGYAYLQISQLEAAKRCFLRILARPTIG